MKYYIIILIVFISINSCKNKIITPEKPTELSVYNELLDTLYIKGFCHFPMIEPENLPIKPTNAYIKKYNEENKKFLDFLDSTQLTIFVFDSLTRLDFSSDKEFILNYLEPGDSLFIKLILENSEIFEPKILNIDSLTQEGIDFKYLSEVSHLKEFKYGQIENGYNLGVMRLSRICFNDSYNIGIFYFIFFGGRSCGYGQYVLIKRENNKWLLHERITNIVS